MNVGYSRNDVTTSTDVTNLLLAAGGSPALDRELQLLSARRRRGVRRGRRVFRRAVRLLVKQRREIDSAFPDDEQRPS